MSLVLRNYVTSVAVVVLSSVMLSNLFYQSSRFANQERVDGFTHYLGAGIVFQAESIGH
jgi:hypothetical protein